jgi:hypothetical protein
MLRKKQDSRKYARRRTFLFWLPFLAGLGAYGWWRLVYLPSTFTAGDPNNPLLLQSILKTPVSGLFTLANHILNDLRYLLIDVWANAFYNQSLYDLHAKVLWVAWFLGILAALLFGLAIKRAGQENGRELEDSIFQPVLFGMVAFLAGGAPVWLTDRQVSFGTWSDRFSLAPMLGSVVFIVYLIAWICRTRRQLQGFLTILLAFSIAVQVWNANSFRLDQNLQKDIYWQLAWRIPSLKPGTAIIGKGTFTGKSSYYDATYIMNLLFEQQVKASPDYAYFDVFHLPFDEYDLNVPLTFTTRSGQFSGITPQAIGMYFNLSGGCVRILDEVYADDPNFTKDINSFDSLNRLIAISNPDQFIADSDAVKPDPALFGAEPSHGWCYYFEKADLARQKQDWQAVLRLGEEAVTKGIKPVLGAEYIPFIEAHARMGEWSQAYELSARAWLITPELGPSLCNNWNRFDSFPGGDEKDTYFSQATASFCSSPTK